MVVIDPIGRDVALSSGPVDRPSLRDLEHGNDAGAVSPFPPVPPLPEEARDGSGIPRGSRQLVRRGGLLRLAR